MKNVALIIESSTQYGRNLLKGISDYALLHGWVLRFDLRGIRSNEPEWLEHCQCDGIITHCPNQQITLQRQSEGVSVLDCHHESFNGQQTGSFVDSDHQAVGKNGALYLYQKKYSKFAFVGYQKTIYSKYRMKGFCDALEALEALDARPKTIELALNEQHGNILNEEALAQFISELELPCAIMCACDELAFRVATICKNQDITVPEQVAILGVDNDELTCNLSFPSISSIDPNIKAVGTEMAKVLDQLMNGVSHDKIDFIRQIKPRGVVERQSTAYIPVDDPILAKSLEVIRLEACSGVTIDEIAERCNVSRRSLERKFSENVGMTMKKIMTEVKIKKVKEFLERTNYTIAHIADLTGFQYAERLSVMFKRETGETPGQYRKNNSK